MIRLWLTVRINTRWVMLYEVVLRGTYFGQEIINRWNYLSTGVPAAVSGSFALASAFGGVPSDTPPVYPSNSILASIRATTVTTMVWNSLTVRAAADYAPADFYEAPFGTGLAGTQPAQGMSPVMSFGFRTNIVRTDIRRATKRFPGVGEDFVDAGGVVISGALANLQTIADRMSAILTYTDEGNTLSFAPCVVSKEKYEPRPGRTAYRYYPTLTLQEQHIATGIQWTPYTTVRSQTSRQYGRGR